MDLRVRNKLVTLFEKYKTVFRQDIAVIPGREYITNCDIEGKLSGAKVCNYFRKLPDAVRDSIVQNFDTLAADGVLKCAAEDGINVQNIIPTFAITQKMIMELNLVYRARICDL